MQVILLTNMPAYQQIELAEAFVALLGAANFRLAVYGSLSKSRQQMGWVDDYQKPYLLRFKDSPTEKQETLDWIANADVVIHGRFPIKYVRTRIRAGRLTYAYQERIWKKRLTPLRFISRIAFLIKNYYSVNRANYHLLAAGRYAASDLQRIGVFKRRAWKFGYFISAKSMPSKPAPKPLKIIWCGRLMPLKRPQRALEFAAILHNESVDFTLELVGDGEMRKDLEARAKTLGIADFVTFAGWQDVKEVDRRMSQAHVFLMSSDAREGWGVVINEAINNGCYAIVCDEVGSARWLVDDQKTGVVYQDANFASVCKTFVQRFVNDPNAIALQALRGQQRLTEHWSCAAAAERLVEHANAYLQQADLQMLFSDGPCSAVD